MPKTTKDNKRILQLEKEFFKLSKKERKIIRTLLELQQLGVIKIGNDGQIHKTRFGYQVKKELVKQGKISNDR